MNKALSIIIPTYNAEQYIARCIDSILHQGLDPTTYEILIMNDGSTDGTVGIVQQYIDNGHPIALHSHENVGCDGTRNKGFKFATGAYIYIMDADDYLAYDCLNTIVKRALEDDLQIVSFDVLFTGEDAAFEAEENPADIKKPEIITGREYIKNHRNCRFETWWFITKRSFLEETGVRFETGNACSDTYYMVEHFLRATRMAHYPTKIYRYYDAPTSLTRDKEDKGYVARMLNDFGKTSIGFSEILLRLKNEKEPVDPQLFNNLAYRRDCYVVFYISLMIRAGYTKKQMKEALRELEEKEAYPVTNFLGPEYNSLKYKISTFVINQKSLLLNLAPIHKMMRS